MLITSLIFPPHEYVVGDFWIREWVANLLINQSTNQLFDYPPSILRATCAFDAKMGVILDGWRAVSLCRKSSKKIFGFFDFCFQLSAYLIENSSMPDAWDSMLDVIARPAFGPSTADGNLNCYILDCFVIKLLAMTAQRQLIPRERLRIFELLRPYIYSTVSSINLNDTRLEAKNHN